MIEGMNQANEAGRFFFDLAAEAVDTQASHEAAIMSIAASLLNVAETLRDLKNSLGTIAEEYVNRPVN